jgi:hypothetical protein
LLMGRLMPRNSKVTVKWPKHDVGHVWIWDPHSKEYIKATNTRQQYASLTLEQAQFLRASLRSNDPANEIHIVDGTEAITSRVQQIMASKKLGDRRRGARFGNMTSAELREGKPENARQQPATTTGAPGPEPTADTCWVDDQDEITLHLPEHHEPF